MRILLVFTLCFVSILGFSQSKDSLWTTGGTATLMFNQTSLTNWAAGGANSIAFNMYGAFIANYASGRSNWNNRLDMGYGLIKQGNKEFVKADDKFILVTKYGYSITSDKKLFLTSLADFRTQFGQGFAPDSDSLISNFLAPAYILFGFGLDYKPTENISLYYAPVQGKFTIVNDETLSDLGAFGVEPGEIFRSELGSYLRFAMTQTIMPQVVLDTKLELFSNYLVDFGNIDVNWELNLNMKVNKFITATVLTNLIYDDDIKIPLKRDNDGNVIKSGPRVQFKSVIGVGLAYRFGAAIPKK